MAMMENAEEVFQVLEDFSKRKPKTIPQELNDYLTYVARTGDPVYQWTLVKCLFKEKLLNVITDFYETTPGIEIPPYPNVDPFNYDIMKNSLLERLDSFTSAPFTVQRLCELLTTPRKQYNRVDKFMRAIEKNILVVSTTEPGIQRHVDQENGEAMEPIVNGSDNNSEYNVDVEMEDMSWKENTVQKVEPQPSSSDAHITVDDIESRLLTKEEITNDSGNKTATPFVAEIPSEPSVSSNEQMPEQKVTDIPQTTAPIEEKQMAPENVTEVKDEKSEPAPAIEIPEIKVDDAEITKQKLTEQADAPSKSAAVEENPTQVTEIKTTEIIDNTIEDKAIETQEHSSDENSSEMIMQDTPDTKTTSEVLTSEVSTSSEESSSSDNTDGNSNSPKTDNDAQIDTQEDSSQDTKSDSESKTEFVPIVQEPAVKIESENYSITDVKSELQPIKLEMPVPSVDDVPPEGKPSEQAGDELVEPIKKKSEVDTKSEDVEPKTETEEPTKTD